MMTFKKEEFPSISNDECIDIDSFTNFWKEASSTYYQIKLASSNAIDVLHFKNEVDRDKAFDKITRKKENKNTTMKTVFEDIKEFIKENRNVVYYLALILIVDRFFLGGQLVSKIKTITEKLLGKVEKSIEDKQV